MKQRPTSTDPPRTRLRKTVAAVDHEIRALKGSSSELDAAWTRMVEELALGPEPELRQCPNCGNTAMHAATLCGHCWTKLTPAEA
jgi:hypothetical protein